MTAQINNNGDTRSELTTQQRLVHNAANALLAALRDAMPNGRNYQTCDPDIYQVDVDAHARRYGAVMDIKREAMAEAISLDRQ